MASKPTVVLTIKEFSRRGGLSRARNLTPEQRTEAARKAAQARWAAKNSPDPNEPTRADLRPVSDKGTSIMSNSRRRGPKPCHSVRTRKSLAFYKTLPLFGMENELAVA